MNAYFQGSFFMVLRCHNSTLLSVGGKFYKKRCPSLQILNMAPIGLHNGHFGPMQQKTIKTTILLAILL
jgi:hypothetical protein